MDLESAYRSVAIRPSNYKFMGMKWRLDGFDKYLVDTRCCFGGSKNPGIFNRLTQAVRRFMKKRGFSLVAMLDDMLLICKMFEECVNGRSVLTRLLRELGFAINWKKVTEISHEVTFLGGSNPE